MTAWVSDHAWLYIGSICGSIIAMLMARGLTLGGRIQTLVVGTIAGCIAGPAICEVWFSGYDPKTSSVPSFICAFVGLVALGVIPIIRRNFEKLVSKWQFKIVPAEPSNE